MSGITRLEEHTIYENPEPKLRSSHGKFPGLAKLPSGDLIALFEIGEAFGSVDSRGYVTRSSDDGRTWNLEGPICDMTAVEPGRRMGGAVKPTVLDDGSLVGIGYFFDRTDPDLNTTNPETKGLLPGYNVVTFSSDEGKSWTLPTRIDTGYPEVLETSGPCIQLRDGDLLAVGPPFKMWDGSNPTGQVGVALRSTDRGKNWDGSSRYFTTPGNRITPWESRVCEMQDGRIVSMNWCYDLENETHLTNHVTVSHDNGHTWSDPIDTGIQAQASNVSWLEGDTLLTIHAHRAGDVGLYLRRVDFANDKWNVVEEVVIWGGVKAQDTSKGIIEQFAALQFGQPSLLHLDGNEYLATHWCIEECLGKIKTHRLKITG